MLNPEGQIEDDLTLRKVLPSCFMIIWLYKVDYVCQLIH